MYTGIYFLIEAIVYSMLLMTVYFRKKVFKSKENKVYSILVVVSFFELIVELILDFVGPMYKEIPNVSYFVARLFSFGVELWITILLCYVLFVCLSIKKKERYIPVVRNIAIVLMIIFTTLNFILPLNFKYDGYIARQIKQVEQFKKLEKKRLPQNFDYNTISGLRIEAQQKLNLYQPSSIGQASRISGVTPADTSVLLVYLEQLKYLNPDLFYQLNGDN